MWWFIFWVAQHGFPNDLSRLPETIDLSSIWLSQNLASPHVLPSMDPNIEFDVSVHPSNINIDPQKGEAPAKIETLLSNLHRDQNARNASKRVSAMKVFRHLVWVEEIFSIAPYSGKTNFCLDMALLKPSTTCFIWPNKASSCFYTFWIQETVWGHLGRRVHMMPAWHGGLSFAGSHGNHFTSVIVPNPQYGGWGKKAARIFYQFVWQSIKLPLHLHGEIGSYASIKFHTFKSSKEVWMRNFRVTNFSKCYKFSKVIVQ